MVTETLAAATKITRNFKENVYLLGHNLEPQLIRHKKMLKLKRMALSGRFSAASTVVTEAKWRPLLQHLGNVEYIASDFFLDFDQRTAEKYHYLKDKILLVSNTLPQANIPGEGREGPGMSLRSFINACVLLPETLILGWDWDNHHMPMVSIMMALVSDIYLPAHDSLDYETSEQCDHVRLTPLSSHQWSRATLVQNFDLIVRMPRSQDVYGKFVNYPIFAARNAQIDSLAGKLDGVGFLDDIQAYWKKTPRERLEEWTQYKCHWIIPTLNDISTRLFDGLITGGVLIIPRKFVSKPLIRTLDERDYVVFDHLDTVNPEAVLQQALAKFDQGGLDGVVRRHRFALDQHNFDVRYHDIMRTMEDVLARTRAS